MDRTLKSMYIPVQAFFSVLPEMIRDVIDGKQAKVTRNVIVTAKAIGKIYG